MIEDDDVAHVAKADAANVRLEQREAVVDRADPVVEAVGGVDVTAVARDDDGAHPCALPRRREAGQPRAQMDFNAHRYGADPQGGAAV